MAKSMAVVEHGAVINIIWASSDEPETDTWKDFADRPVGIGDEYRDGKFWREGAEILTPLEEAQKQLQEQEQAHLEELAELMEEIYQEDTEVIEE